MRLFQVIAVMILVVATQLVGCISTQNTRGFQTNPPVRTSKSNPANKLVNAIGSGKKKIESARIPPSDPTSLQSPGTVTPELFVVAGEMSMERQAYDSAEHYFKKALKLEPKNIKANVGLARIAKAKGNDKKVKEIFEKLNKWYPGQGHLINSLGNRGRSKPVGFVVEPVSENVLAKYEEIQSQKVAARQSMPEVNGGQAVVDQEKPAASSLPETPGQIPVDRLDRVTAKPTLSGPVQQAAGSANLPPQTVVTRQASNNQIQVNLGSSDSNMARRIKNPFFSKTAVTQASYQQEPDSSQSNPTASQQIAEDSIETSEIFVPDELRSAVFPTTPETNAGSRMSITDQKSSRRNKR